jgi:GNAT superfamily N-acetyltransferase
LVVDELVRGQGIGQALLGAAEHWVRERGLTHLTIRSNTTRTAASLRPPTHSRKPSPIQHESEVLKYSLSHPRFSQDHALVWG